MRALARVAAENETPMIVPAGVLAEAWRDGARQVRLARFLSYSRLTVDVLDEPAAKAAGALCGRSGTEDVVDATVVIAARSRGALVVTTDAADLRRIDRRLELVTI